MVGSMDTASKQNAMKKFAVAVALFDFTPSVAEELKLLSGDVVSIQKDVDDFWFYGKKLCGNVEGQFPKEFVKEVDLPSKNTSDVYYFALDTFYPETTADLHFQKGDIVICDKVIDDSWASGYCDNNHGMFPLNYVQKLPITSLRTVDKKERFLGIATAILPLTAQLEEELSFDVGDQIEITEVLDDGWYKGQIGSETGIFPSAFVKLKTALKQPNQQEYVNNPQALDTRGNNDMNSESTPQQFAVSLGEIKTTPAQRPSSTNQKHSQNNNNKSNVSTDIYQFSAKKENQNNYVKEKSDQKDLDLKVYNSAIFKVYSTHNFVGNSSTELAFGEGVRIDILEETDAHWYIGRLGIRVGYVPRSYVSKMNPNTPSGKLPRHSSFNSPQTTAYQQHPNKLLHSHSESNIKLVMQPANNFVANLPSSAKSSLVSNPVYNGLAEPVDPAEPVQVNGDKPKKYCEVLYNYISQGSNDLTVAIGEKLELCREYDENWTEVVNKKSEKGIVPTNYVKIIATNVNKETKDMNQITMNLPQHKPTPLNVNNNSTSYEKPQYILPKQQTNIFTAPSINNHNPVKNSPTKSLYQHNALTSPKPFQSQHQAYKSVNISNHFSSSNQTNGQIPDADVKDEVNVDVPDGSVMKTNEVEAVKKSTTNNRRQQARERRSKSYVNTEVIDKHLHVWQSMYDNSVEKERTLNSVDEHPDKNNYEIPIEQRKIKQRSAVRRTASMKERTRPRNYGNNLKTNNNFSNVNPDSKLNHSVELTQESLLIKNAQQAQENQISNTSVLSGNTSVLPGNTSVLRGNTSVLPGNTSVLSGDTAAPTTVTDTAQPSALPTQMSRLRGSLSTSTGSSESLTSHSGSRNSTTSHSETSGKDSLSQGSIFPTRAPPPLPIRKPLLPVSSTVSPPPPRRKESLHNNIVVTVPTTRPLNSTPPVRPAPMRPKSTVKKPPSRPFNPPRTAASAHTKSMHKMKIEKVRADIEEYSRMKADLEHLYAGTNDGKERREIAENLGFVKTNLKRLQTEFQNLINDSDHIYEAIEHRIQPVTPTTPQSLEVTAVPDIPTSPGSIRKKKLDKRLNIMNELVSTERDFLQDVTITVEDIMQPLTDKVLPIDIPLLFGNIHEIKEFSQSLLNSLTRALEVEQQYLEGENMQQATDIELMFGSCFINHVPRMQEVYKIYCRGHDDAIAMLEKYETDKDEKTKEIMTTITSLLQKIKSKTNVFDLGSFLIKPVQRVLKYPLLLNELIRVSEYPPTDSHPSSKHPDYDNLMRALAMMGEVANAINEVRRRKDLVRKYRKTNNDGITEKIGRISLKSGKKKINRISKKLGRVTGISTTGERDVKFDELFKRFRIIERAVKSFRSNVESYCGCYNESVTTEMSLAFRMMDFVGTNEVSHPAARFHTAASNIAGAMYRNFHNQVNMQVLTPVSTLIARFKGPQTIIDKRLDKLIDYDTCQKNSDSKQKIEETKRDYEALNTSLLDELPKLCDLSRQLLSSCAALFVKLHRVFTDNFINELVPIISDLQREEGLSENVQRLNAAAIIDKFNKEHAQAVKIITDLHFMPSSIMGCVNPTLDQRKRSLSSNKKTDAEVTVGNNSAIRETLLKKYSADQLCVVIQTVSATQLMDLSCKVNELVGVKKRQDPMGNAQRWFVDNGVATGFVLSSVLRMYNPQTDGQTSTGNLIDITSSPPLANKPSPTPVPRTRSRSPSASMKSTSSVDSSTSANSNTMSPYTFRQSISRTVSSKSDESGQLTPAMISALDQEAELLDDDFEPQSAPAQHHCKAEYEFAARTNLELSMKRGDIVAVIMQHDVDNNPEWWLCAMNGRQGYVPAAYLTKAEYL